MEQSGKTLGVIEGTVVRSLRGHDKGIFYLVVRIDDNRVMVADGKYRTLEKPKAKNPFHIAATAQVFELPKTDKKLRELLFQFNHKGNT
jgi:Ribosomal protein L14E/L6E/L27E